MFCLGAWTCTMCISGIHGGQGRGIRFDRPGLMYSCEPSCGCSELNLGSLQDRQVRLTTEASFQPPSPARLAPHVHKMISFEYIALNDKLHYLDYSAGTTQLITH